MKAVWTPMGLESLDKTTRFIEEQWNDEIVDIFLERLDSRIDQIKINPEIGPVYKKTNFRQLLIHPLVTLYYEVKSEYINLLLIWANKQDPDEFKRKIKQM